MQSYRLSRRANDEEGVQQWAHSCRPCRITESQRLAKGSRLLRSALQGYSRPGADGPLGSRVASAPCVAFNSREHRGGM